MKKMTGKNTLMLFLTAFIWGTAFVAQSVGMDYIGPFTFTCVRSLIGGIFRNTVHNGRKSRIYYSTLYRACADLWNFFEKESRSENLDKRGNFCRRLVFTVYYR